MPLKSSMQSLASLQDWYVKSTHSKSMAKIFFVGLLTSI